MDTVTNAELTAAFIASINAGQLTESTTVTCSTAAYRPDPNGSDLQPFIDILLLKGTNTFALDGRRFLSRRASASSIRNTTVDQSTFADSAAHQSGHLLRLCECGEGVQCLCARNKYGSELTVNASVPFEAYWTIFRVTGVNFIYLTPKCQCGSRMIFVRNQSIWRRVKRRIQTLTLGHRPDIVCPNSGCRRASSRQIHCLYRTGQQQWVKRDIFRPITDMTQLHLEIPGEQVALVEQEHESFHRAARQGSPSRQRAAPVKK